MLFDEFESLSEIESLIGVVESRAGVGYRPSLPLSEFRVAIESNHCQESEYVVIRIPASEYYPSHSLEH